MTEGTPAAERDGAVPIIGLRSRVVVIDAANRTLLFGCREDDGRGFVWFTPGGGGEPGESPEETARRELREETGLGDGVHLADLGRRRVVRTLDGVTYESREHWFVARVPVCDIDTGGFTEEEVETIGDHRWWSAEELERTRDRLVPGNLPALIRDLIEHGPPEHPIDIGR
jgi:8-oxo-dGTP pyrophosphatase MutT (NUDIX family)